MPRIEKFVLKIHTEIKKFLIKMLIIGRDKLSGLTRNGLAHSQCNRCSCSDKSFQRQPLQLTWNLAVVSDRKEEISSPQT